MPRVDEVFRRRAFCSYAKPLHRLCLFIRPDPEPIVKKDSMR